MAEAVELAGRCDRADDRLTNEIYTDLWAMKNQYDLDLDWVTAELVEIVRERKPRVVKPVYSLAAAASARRSASSSR